jgi:hypothetical protein
VTTTFGVTLAPVVDGGLAGVVTVLVVVVVFVVGVVVVLVVGVVVVLVVVVVLLVVVVLVVVVVVVVRVVVVVVVRVVGVVVVRVVGVVVGDVGVVTVVVVVTVGGGTATIGGSDAAVVVLVVVVVVVVLVGVVAGGGGGDGWLPAPPVLPAAPMPPCRAPPLEAGGVLEPSFNGATAEPCGVEAGATRVPPTNGLWPLSAAAPTVPLPGSAGLELVATLAERLPPGIAGPLNTWPSAPSPCRGTPPVTANSTPMMAAGIRTATRDAP